MPNMKAICLKKPATLLLGFLRASSSAHLAITQQNPSTALATNPTLIKVVQIVKPWPKAWALPNRYVQYIPGLNHLLVLPYLHYREHPSRKKSCLTPPVLLSKHQDPWPPLFFFLFPLLVQVP
ncbi:hypothetical protein F4775DRAFT_179409 [Biscogniauxia sp. FL1348]|nr:hypothetical protein F4775DRAFT_179409 [Biscogniauxia sp. FL1348]